MKRHASAGASASSFDLNMNNDGEIAAAPSTSAVSVSQAKIHRTSANQLDATTSASHHQRSENGASDEDESEIEVKKEEKAGTTAVIALSPSQAAAATSSHSSSSATASSFEPSSDESSKRAKKKKNKKNMKNKKKSNKEASKSTGNDKKSTVAATATAAPAKKSKGSGEEDEGGDEIDLDRVAAGLSRTISRPVLTIVNTSSSWEEMTHRLMSIGNEHTEVNDQYTRIKLAIIFESRLKKLHGPQYETFKQFQQRTRAGILKKEEDEEQEVEKKDEKVEEEGDKNEPSYGLFSRAGNLCCDKIMKTSRSWEEFWLGVMAASRRYGEIMDTEVRELLIDMFEDRLKELFGEEAELYEEFNERMEGGDSTARRVRSSAADKDSEI